MQNSEWNLAGKAILVTGASSGIGAATAVALGRQRARVVLAARRVADCEAVAEQVRAAGGDACAAFQQHQVVYMEVAQHHGLAAFGDAQAEPAEQLQVVLT